MYRSAFIISTAAFLIIGCGSDKKKEEAVVKVETTESQVVVQGSSATSEVSSMSKATLKPVPDAVKKGNFTVQIGAFRSESRAHKAIKKYKDMGYDAYIEESKVMGGERTWYRVRIGRYQRSSDAKRIADELNARGNIKAWVDNVSR